MSVKFEIRDWRFEITWRELTVTPRAGNETQDEAGRFAVRQAASLSRTAGEILFRTSTPSWQLVGHSLRGEQQNELD